MLYEVITEGLIGEDVLAQALASQFGLPYRDLVQAPPPAEAVELITPELMLRFECVPLGQSARGLEVTIADPTRLRGLDDLEMLLDQRLEHVLAP